MKLDKSILKLQIRRIFRKLGYDLSKYAHDLPGKYPYEDIRKFLQKEKPTIFDIGAAKGETIVELKSIFPGSIIHSFEPSPSTFESLEEYASGIKNVSVWNCGIGDKVCEMDLHENSDLGMNSFKELGSAGWGVTKKNTKVKVNTIDQFCTDNNIALIDLLKIDTQGFELNVLKGAEQTLNLKNISFIYLEVNYLPIYKDIPSISELYDYLTKKDFILMSIYPSNYVNNFISTYSDCLFVHKKHITKDFKFIP